jgi:hypothetical protein
MVFIIDKQKEGGMKMKNKNLVWLFVLLFIFLFSTTSGMCADDGMGSYTKDISISTTKLNEWMPRLTYNSIDNEFMVTWFTSGIRQTGGKSEYSIDGRRVSADGDLLGEPFLGLNAIGPEVKTLPTPAFNEFLNQYMIAYTYQQPETAQDLYISILAHDGGILLDGLSVSNPPTNASHPFAIFNPTKRQYLTVYNDNRNGNTDNFGSILNEDGSIVKKDIPICIQPGVQFNPYPCYNSKDDTYLIAWEEFRHVSTWEEPGEIYGSLMDSSGNILVEDIKITDDFGKENEGDQRVEAIAYNADRNEFLVAWWDSRPSLDGNGVMGRIIKADGTPAGPDFVLADGPGIQSYPHLVYVDKRKKYFIIWDDSRNDPNTTRDTITNWDVYGKWLDSTGQPEGDGIPICKKEGVQDYSELAYSPLMDRFLIIWREEVPGEGGTGDLSGGHVKDVGGNLYGKIYGMPSFLTCRVVEQGTGTPIEEAKVTVLGLCAPMKETTNKGGWTNIIKETQRNGSYLVIASKSGYKTGFQLMTFSGEPMQYTMELKKR